MGLAILLVNMFKLTLLLAIASTLGLSGAMRIGYRESLSQEEQISSRIVGGEDAKEGEFPYQAQIRVNGSHYCGGVIIGEDVILTAAHCVTKNINEYEVAAGFINIKQPGPNLQTSKIKKINSHPFYPVTGRYDIALMILNTPLKMTPFVQKINLPAKDEEFEGETILSGWGSISRGMNLVISDILQKVKLPLLTYKACKEYFQNAFLIQNDSTICTGPIGGNLSACLGDSGGPLVKEIQGKKYVVGLVSWGSFPCGNGTPTVYAKVSGLIDFINKNSK